MEMRAHPSDGQSMRPQVVRRFALLRDLVPEEYHLEICGDCLGWGSLDKWGRYHCELCGGPGVIIWDPATKRYVDAWLWIKPFRKEAGRLDEAERNQP